jgi:hypothetical protein
MTRRTRVSVPREEEPLPAILLSPSKEQLLEEPQKAPAAEEVLPPSESESESVEATKVRAEEVIKVSERTRIYPSHHVEKKSHRRLKFSK